ncbi:hypothetical protein FRC01_006854, partial [Tulasnella sp. 417]
MDIAPGDAGDSRLWGGLERTVAEWFSASDSGSSGDDSGPVDFLKGSRKEFERLNHPPANGKVTTSIQDLPVELLALILYYAAQIPRSGLTRLQEFSTVCSIWRHAVKGTPILWSRVTDDDPVHLVERAMYESKDAPLDIDIQDGFWKRQKPGELERRIRLVCLHMKRWRYANIDVIDASEWLFKALAAPIAPRLKTIKLRLFCRPIPSIKVFQGAMLPLLQELDICGLQFEGGIGQFRNLRVLKINTTDAFEPSLSEVTTLLRSLPRLEEFGFKGDLQSPRGENNPSATSYQPITLPQLKRLFVITRKSKGSLEISNCIRAPVCLDISLAGDPFRDDASPHLIFRPP